jgi:hypothetical protein
MTVADLTIESDAGDGKTTAFFEDDGEVAYCYILQDGEFVSDVWLYNRSQSPLEKPWKTEIDPPYLNPLEYSNRLDKFPEKKDDISIDWRSIDGEPSAFVSLFDELLGYVSASVKPGHARLAKKNGPLAKMIM